LAHTSSHQKNWDNTYAYQTHQTKNYHGAPRANLAKQVNWWMRVMKKEEEKWVKKNWKSQSRGDWE